MNHKRGEIEGFIQNGLAETVEEALRGGAVARQTAQAEELRQTTERIKESFGEYAIGSKGELNESFQETPLGKQYLDLRSKTGGAVDLEELKATIFNHVYTFFSRYYDNGDFLSKRRYSRRQKYAVPYNGEEVYLHWANADQYYVKTGEHFTDYRFKNNGVTVHFELAAADTEQNNVKGERRFFVPRAKDAVYDEDARTLTIPFEYRPLTAREQTAYGTRNQQEKIIEEAAADLPVRLKKHPEALAALEPAGELERHLRRYTRRNTSDFFVHKDLKGFLEGELDFYLKNEVLDVDDLEAWGPERSDSWFEVMRAVKTVGRGVIAFLAQIEDFQKRLFEKKKLVVSTGYCITLDRVPEELYPEVVASDAQREEWKGLFHIHEIEESITQPGYSEPLTEEFLKANPFLVLDTKHFSEDFKDRLLASIEDLDEQTGGLLIESENFQALNLLQERYREQVKCIYIDPPYNTSASEILYKNDYKHSSWLSLIDNRVGISKSLLTKNQGTFCVTIDDTEFHRLWYVTVNHFSAENHIGTVLIRNNPQGRATVNGLRVNHEYAMFFASDDAARTVGRFERTAEKSARWDEVDEAGLPYLWENFRKTGTDSQKNDRPKQHYPIYTDGRSLRIPEMRWIVGQREWEILESPSLSESVLWPVDEGGTHRVWKWGHKRVLENPSHVKVQGNGGQKQVYNRNYLNQEGALPGTWWDKPQYAAGSHGTNLLSDMFGTGRKFLFPKSVYAVEDCLRVAGTTEASDDYLLRYMLDFETRGSASLLNVEKLAAPFRYTLRLRDGEEKRSVSVDLPETFAYLLGLRVRSRKAYHDGERRYLVYRGSTPERGEVAAIWRDTEGWTEADFERDRDFARENVLAEDADEVFVNGDSFIPEARPLESVFKQRMLAEPANGR
jgi:adenine-specific DNA-methyltransferase